MIKNIRVLAVIGAMVLSPVAVFAEDVPMTEEEILYYEEDYAVEAQTEEEALIVAEEDGFLEEDGLIAAQEDDEILEAASEGDVFIDEKTFPDENFRAFLKSKYANGGDVISGSTISETIKIDVEDKGIKDLTGIKIFTNLQKLDCTSNYLTSLDLSGCTSLTDVYCYNNNLEKLDVSGCTNLERFFCYENNLSSLDVSGCTDLISLLCSNNQLTSLDLHECTKLRCLFCDENPLTSLDISFCPTLKELYESTTPEIVNGYQYYSKGDAQLGVDPDVNIITDSTFNEGDVFIDKSTFPDENFRAFLKSKYANGGVLLSSETISGITDMSIYNKSIGDLTGIKVFTNLQELSCNENNLSSLDLSGCMALTKLSCNNNNLTSLDLSGCRNLSELYCYKNQLTSLDLHTCTNLKWLECDGNQLTSLDVSLCRALKELCESTTPTIDEVDGYKYYRSPSVVLFVDPDVEIITVHTHTWDTGRVTKAATTTSTGIRTYTCTVCGGTKKGIIPKLKDKITITKKPGIKKPAATKSKITVKWKHFRHTSKKTRKIWKTIKKVQVQCATDSGFSNIVKDVKIGRGKTKYTVKGLAKKTAYYVRVRYFDGVGYSNWSKVKKVKTK